MAETLYQSSSLRGRAILTDDTALEWVIGPIERYAWEAAHPGETFFNERMREMVQLWAVHNHLSRSGKFTGTFEDFKAKLADIETEVSADGLPKELRMLLDSMAGNEQ